MATRAPGDHVMQTWFRASLQIALGERALVMEIEESARHIAIVGPSGAGKSSILRAIVGCADVNGSLEVFEEPWLTPTTARPSETRRVGWVPQESLLMPHLDARENLLFGPRAKAAWLREVAEGLELLDLLERRVRNLSGGERQRVALGRALLGEPRLVLLDEPHAALDRALRGRVADFLYGWCDAKSLPTILVSHDAWEVDRYAQSVWEVDSGQVLVRPPRA